MPFLQWTRPRRHGAARSHVDHSSTTLDDTDTVPSVIISVPVRTPSGLHPAQLASKRKPGGLALASKECTVCLSDYNEGELVRALPCAHRFHVSCIDHWLAATTTCPVCRTDLSATASDHRVTVHGMIKKRQMEEEN
ncbi:unnamed protein product [Closterium sp. Naga37s-1]|nr:unnamed protein product [Closterium sp. Naga37s-1]